MIRAALAYPLHLLAGATCAAALTATPALPWLVVILRAITE